MCVSLLFRSFRHSGSCHDTLSVLILWRWFWNTIIGQLIKESILGATTFAYKRVLFFVTRRLRVTKQHKTTLYMLTW